MTTYHNIPTDLYQVIGSYLSPSELQAYRQANQAHLRRTTSLNPTNLVTKYGLQGPLTNEQQRVLLDFERIYPSISIDSLKQDELIDHDIPLKREARKAIFNWRVLTPVNLERMLNYFLTDPLSKDTQTIAIFVLNDVIVSLAFWYASLSSELIRRVRDWNQGLGVDWGLSVSLRTIRPELQGFKFRELQVKPGYTGNLEELADYLTQPAELEALVLRGLGLQLAPAFVQGLPALTSLDLSHNQLQYFEAPLTDGKMSWKLDSLDLSYNQLSEAPECLTVPQIRSPPIWVNLSHNAFTKFPAVVTYYPTTFTLDLSHNDFSSGEETPFRIEEEPIVEQGEHAILNLSYCQLRTLPTSLFRVQQDGGTFLASWRMIVDFSRNYLTTLPPLKFDLPPFILDEQGNPTSERSTINLAVDLSYNRLLTFDGQVIENVQELDLSHNRLRVVTSLPSKLSRLNLSYNPLTKLVKVAGTSYKLEGTGF